MIMTWVLSIILFILVIIGAVIYPLYILETMNNELKPIGEELKDLLSSSKPFEDGD